MQEALERSELDGLPDSLDGQVMATLDYETFKELMEKYTKQFMEV